MLKKIRLIACIGLATFALTGYAKSQPLSADVGFVSFGNLPTGSSQINPIRLKAIQETATTLGARGALAWRALQIDNTLKNESQYLDNVFNFNRLLINGDVLPPVLVEAENSFNLSSSNAIRLASKIYKIEAPARFVSVAPTWRTYLWMDFNKPTLPNKALFPTTQAEATAWNAYFKEGWKEGLQQANEIFAENLSRLKRDYTGMMLYRKLLDQQMVSPPFVSRASLGVTGNSNEIRINDRMARITEKAKLQPDSKSWKPVFTK